MTEMLDEGPFYHGTVAALGEGDLLTAGRRSNYRPEIIMNHIYFTSILDGAGLAAEIAAELVKGGTPHVYLVEPTGAFENDANVTDKKFPGTEQAELIRFEVDAAVYRPTAQVNSPIFRWPLHQAGCDGALISWHRLRRSSCALWLKASNLTHAEIAIGVACCQNVPVDQPKLADVGLLEHVGRQRSRRVGIMKHP